MSNIYAYKNRKEVHNNHSEKKEMYYGKEFLY